MQNGRTILAGKVALVTGASRGIGRAVAERLAESGATVVVNFARRTDLARQVVDGIKSAGGHAMAIGADISRPEETKRLFEDTVARCGLLDILVANAGYASFAPLADTTDDEFDRMFAVNTKGTFLCLREASRHIADNGRIVCISTIGTILNGAGGACYFASKAAIEQLCRVLAHELGPRGITVNTVSPGFTDTDMLTETGGREAATFAWIHDITPLERLGSPREIAAAVRFLVGPDGGWVNRQNLAVDGGIISR